MATNHTELDRGFSCFEAVVKYTIYNVDQSKAVEFSLKLADVVILNWTREIIGLPKAFRKELDGKAYWWLKVDQLLEDYPILQMKKATVLKKLKQFEKDGFFQKIDEVTPLGHFGYYSPTEKYESLFSHSEKNASGSNIKTHSEKNPTGSEKNPTGSEKNPTGSEKNPTIPSYYNPEKNTIPLIPREKMGKEEEEAFHFLKEKLQYADEKKLIHLSVKHGIGSVRIIFDKLQKDIRCGRVKGVGALLGRLDSSKKVVERSRVKVLDIERGLHISDNGNEAKFMLKNGVLSKSLK